jgi:uncharacterized protein (TIGR03663 family)
MAKRARRGTAMSTTGSAPSAAQAKAASPEPPVDPNAWTVRDPRYWPVLGALFVLAAALRIFHLDTPPFQHDESIYSIFSLNFHDYNFDPVYHGPVLYHIIKLFFVLFGDTDFSARMVSVVMGLLTLGLVMGPGRRWLGDRGALFATALYTLSPVMVTYQRRIIFDAFVVLLTLGAIFLFQAALSGVRGSWPWRWAWIGLTALLTAFLATKANAFFVVAMLGSFWVLDLTRGVGPRDFLVRLPRQLPILMFGALSLAAMFALRDENKVRNERMLAVVGVVASALLWEWLRRPAYEPRAGKKAPRAAEASRVWPPTHLPDPVTVLLAVLAAVLVFAFFFGHGYLWFQKPLEIRQTLVQYWPDIRSAMPRMLEYWGGQQKEPRLPGRHDFYLPLLMLYELPILLVFVAGVVRASRNRTPFTDLLLWWSFTSWTLYAMANEKVPWLMIHLVAPFALLGGWWLGQLTLRSRQRTVAAVLGVLGIAYMARNVSATNYERAVDHREPMFYAFTGESFKDTFFHAVEISKTKTGDFWIYNAWPPSWYMRPSFFGKIPNAVPYYPEHDPPAGPLRLVMCMEPEWEKYREERFAGWHKWTWENGHLVQDGTGENPHILNWPRASWKIGGSEPWTLGSMRPDKWAHWFITREASLPESPDPFLTEWSHIPVVVATPP